MTNRVFSKHYKLFFKLSLFCIPAYIFTIFLYSTNKRSDVNLLMKSKMLLQFKTFALLNDWLNDHECIVNNGSGLEYFNWSKDYRTIENSYYMTEFNIDMKVSHKFLKSFDAERNVTRKWESGAHSPLSIATERIKKVLPRGTKIDHSVPSLNEKLVVWTCNRRAYNNEFELMKSRFRPFIQGHSTRKVSLYLSDYSGNHSKLIGQIEVIGTKMNPYPWFGNLKWVPGNTSISFMYDNNLYLTKLNDTVPSIN